MQTVETLQVELPGIGEPESLRLQRRRLPAPGPGEALVRMETTGVSFAEQQMRRGKYYDQPSFPFVPGYDLVGVPDGLDAVAAETVIVNGVTAWRMLHRTAKVRAGQTIVVLGAAGGVGSVLLQLARHAGIAVIGVAGPRQREAVEALGATFVDYRGEDVPARVAELAPTGVAAVFDHVGGPGIVASWRMLGRGGTLVSYGTAATKDDAGDPRLPVLRLLGRLLLRNALPNGRRAHFFNLWAGRRGSRATAPPCAATSSTSSP